MKTIAGVVLIFSLLDLFQCAPLIGNDEDDTEYYIKETQSSNKWGYNAGIGLDLGLVAGYKDGQLQLGTKNHFGVDVGGYKESSMKDVYQPIYKQPSSRNYGQYSASDNGYGYQYSQYPYYPQYSYDNYAPHQYTPPYAAPYGAPNAAPQSTPNGAPAQTHYGG